MREAGPGAQVPRTHHVRLGVVQALVHERSAALVCERSAALVCERFVPLCVSALQPWCVSALCLCA